MSWWVDEDEFVVFIVFSVSVLVPLRISWKHVSVVNMFQLSAVSVVRVYHRYTPGVRHVLHVRTHTRRKNR